MRKNDRCSLYFHPRKFIENNIKYRISSGASIAKYKHSQAFLLTELSFNPYHEFSRIAKEILLLKYDVWFDFLCEVEQFLLVNSNKYIDEGCVRQIIDMSDERVAYYEETMGDNPDVFSEDYLATWKQVHEMSYNLLKENIRELKDLNASEFFDGMTEKLINTMNHTLYELHECDVVFFSDGILEFNLDSVCCTYHDKFGESLIVNKYDIYTKVRATDLILIKQYSDVNIPFNQTPLKRILEEKQIKYKVV